MSTSRVFTVNQVLTAALMNDLPQGVLGITSATSDVGPTSGTTELDILTAGAVTIAGTARRIRIHFHARALGASVAGDTFILRIKEGATILSESVYTAPGTGDNAVGSDFEAYVDSPTAASHTYKVTLQRFNGTGTCSVRASASGPMKIVIEDVGQV
jgi:hypothetical protein